MTAHDDNPYVGLRPFEREDSLLFFGRREQTAELLERLNDSHFLGVVGSSGCGKSSLIRAGLEPALLGGFLVEDRDRWRIGEMKPGDAPLRNLAGAVLQALGDDAPTDAAVDSLYETLEEEHTEGLMAKVVPALGDDTNLLLLVDQFEELFAFRGRDDDAASGGRTPEELRASARRKEEAAAFVDLLIGITQQTSRPVYVVLTMRTDFLGDCDLFYGLPETMNRGRYLVPRLSRKQLKQAIAGPARLSGTRLAPRLLDHLLNQLGDRTDRLPVLQHTLARTWDRWRHDGAEGDIDLEHYNHKDVGGLEHALSRHAAEVLGECDADATARVFKCLTASDASHRRVRRPAALSTIVAETALAESEVTAVLDRFAAPGRNFVVRSPGRTPGDPRVDISHESLIRQWETLRNWVDTERKAGAEFTDLAKKAGAWARHDAELLRGRELARARRQLRTTAPAWASRYSQRPDDHAGVVRFIKASISRRHRTWATSAGLALVVLVLGYLGVQRLEQSNFIANRAAEDARLAQERVDRQILAMADISSDPLTGALLLLELDRDAPAEGAFEVALRLAGQSLPETVVRGHDQAVRRVRFSPDGSQLLATFGDGTAGVWPADGRGDPTVLSPPGSRVRTVVLNQDGTRVASATFDGTVRISRVDGSEPVELQDEGSSVAFSPDGRLLTVRNRIARIWPADLQGEPTQLGRGVGSGVDFSPDSSRVVAVDVDLDVWIWSVDGREEVRLPHLTARVRNAMFSPDGARVVTTASDDTVRVWQADGASLPTELERQDGAQAAEVRLRSAIFDPGSTHVLALYSDGLALLWPADGAGEPLPLWNDTAVSWAEFSPDGTRIAAAGAEGTLFLARLGIPGLTMLGEQAGPITDLAFSPDGTRVVTGSADGTVRVWPVRAGGVTFTGHEGPVRSAEFSRDGRLVVTGSGDDTARVWWADGTGEPVPLPHESAVSTATFDRNSSLVLTATEDGVVRIWTVGGDLVRRVTPDGIAADSAAFSADGTFIVTASRDGTTRVWSAANGALVEELNAGEARIHRAVFSPDGSMIVSASEDGTARLWTVGQASDPDTLEGHTGAVGRVAFSPEGSRVVTGSADDTARVWSLDGSAPVELEGHEDLVSSVAFDTDGARVVTASRNGRVLIWSADGGEQLLALDFGGRVNSAAFSPDGTRVVAALENGVARVRSIEWRELIDHLETATTACLTVEERLSLLAEDESAARTQHDECERRFGRAQD